MKISLLFTIAGCATSCRHCHSLGGRGPNIQLPKFKEGVDRLVPIIQSLEQDNEVEIDWNYEPLLHPQFHKILQYVRVKLPSQTSEGSYWPTSGIPLIQNPNINEILSEIINDGTQKLDFTITAAREKHNINVKNNRAYEMFLEAIKIAKEFGLQVNARVILMRDMLVDLPEISSDLLKAGVDQREARVSNYRPLKDIRELEYLRPHLQDIAPYIELIRNEFNDNQDEQWQQPEQYTEIALSRTIEENYINSTFEEIESKMPKWKFITITQELNVYLGMHGFPKAHFGNLLTSDPMKIAKQIMDASPNYGLNAYYHL